MKLIQAILLGTCVFGFSPVSARQMRPDIVGGVEAQNGEFPFIVSLQANNSGHFCGGSLIKKNWVLTAAHCTDPDLSIDKVVIGAHSLSDTSHTETFTVKRVIQHPLRNAETMDYDFALLELSGDSAFAPVALNADEIAIPAPSGDVLATVAGWGATAEGNETLPDALQEVVVPLVSQATCEAAYPDRTTDRMICAGFAAGGKDSCQGDSGGPLLIDKNGQRVLAGVVSWGDGCAEPGKYGIYGKVSAVYDWINSTVP